MELNEIGDAIHGAAMRAHSALGPGLLESACEACLVHEVAKAGMRVSRQVPLSIKYDGVLLEAGYRLDPAVRDSVVVEVKSLEKLVPVHTAQVPSSLELGGYRLGYLLNFDVAQMREGIKRVVNGL